MVEPNDQTTHTEVAAYTDIPIVQQEVFRHRLIVLAMVVTMVLFLIFGMKPAYRWFRNRVINHNLVEAEAAMKVAESAARVEDWGTARDKARSVLIARPGDMRAFRIWERALSEMGEPRTYMAAIQLFMDPQATRQDRVDTLGVLARQAPQALALAAFAILPDDMQQDTAVRVAIAPLLIHRGETAVAEKMLREAPQLDSSPDARLQLLTSLCSRPTPERVAEARALFAKLIAEGSSSQALSALLILGDTPGGLAPGVPLPDLAGWIETQPKATTYQRLRALEPSLQAAPQASASIYENAIKRFIGIDPGALGTWLILHGKADRVIQLLADPSQTNSSAYVARLHALVKEKRAREIAAALREPPSSIDPVELDLALAAAAHMQRDSAGEARAWNQALLHAAFDQTRNRFLDVGKYAGTLGVVGTIEDAWVAAVRVGWGRIPLYRDLLPVFTSLAAQSRSDDLLAMYRSLLRFEPQNPELANNYHYLALLHDVDSPAGAAKALEDLTLAHPALPQLRATLAMAYLMDGRASDALRQLPALRNANRTSPLTLRALEGSALLVNGDIGRGRQLLADMDWKSFMRCENIAFRRVLTRLAIKDLPLPQVAEVETVDPDKVPAWRKAVERIEKERAKDVLPALPALKYRDGEESEEKPAAKP